MNSEFSFGERLAPLVERFVKAYHADERMRHIDCALLPGPAEMEELIRRLLEALYPGFFGRQDLTTHNVTYHVGELLSRIGTLAHRQIYKCLCYRAELNQPNAVRTKPCVKEASRVTEAFMDRLLDVRELLAGDTRAAHDGDPAALNCDEIILAYPGLLAVTVYRLAHELHELNVPMLPRMMSEWAHRQTGVDIHPGARIGKNFFIDHGTGVVIGETTDIGDNVKLYQGVTLGALSIPKDERGRVIRGTKRHPTVEDDVTIYANAIVLGGDTILRKGCVIGGSVVVMSSVPPGATITITPPALRMRERREPAGLHAPATRPSNGDFQI